VRKSCFVLILAAIMILAMVASPTPVNAIDWCEAAALAGWYHQGLNGACLIQIFFDWWASGGYLEPTRYN
jgi:hypothetical protein